MFNKILKSEIEWCEQNPSSMPNEYRRGFIAGLQQADYLIKATIQRSVLQDGEIVDDGDLLDRAAELLRAPVQTRTTEAIIKDIMDYVNVSLVDEHEADFERFLRERVFGV